ncbi:MAG: hypothetical protein Q9217_005163 [Psora testacea]
MYFVIFESWTPSSKKAISFQYYTKLETLLQQTQKPGFISETPYASPHREDQGVLIARFADEASVNKWRLQHDHLKIEKNARESIFDEYRLRIGPEVSSSEEKGCEDDEGGLKGTEKEGKFVVLYKRPKTAGIKESTDNVIGFIDSAKVSPSFDASAHLIHSTNYVGEKSAVWISGWPTEAAATEFRKSLARTQGDDVHLVRVVRDYGKHDRKEAPEGADAAQAASVTEKNESAGA